MLTRYRHDPQAGFSLIELMVVLVILGLVGTIIAGGLTRGLRASNEAQARIEAFEDMQIALERISRDIRGASTPLLAIDVGGTVGGGIQFERLRDGEGDCARYTYWVEDGSLRVSEEQSTDGCDPDTFTAPAERVLVPQLENAEVFTFSTYDDGDLTVIDDPDDIDDISIVTITLTRRPFDQADATVQTDVGLRNTS